MTTIKHINDVLPHIEGQDGFIVMDKGDYSVIDYAYIGGGDMFANPYRLECRGLKFDKSGNLIARPLHKFFNMGEKGITAETIDWTRPHIIMDKLDGSMIHACLLNNEVVFMTRAGRTEHAIRAERHLTDRMKIEIGCDLAWGRTPIFEWTAPENQIVIPYKEDKLTLLAMRVNETGKYYNRESLEAFALYYNVDLVPEVTMQHLEKSGAEGVVIWFTDDDYFLKIKTEEYVISHRAVSYFEREDMVLPAVLNNQIDDLVPVLPKEKADKLLDYHIAVWAELTNLSKIIEVIVKSAKEAEMSRKDFAIKIAAQANNKIRSLYFSSLDGKNTLDSLKEKVLLYPEILKTRWDKNATNKRNVE